MHTALRTACGMLVALSLICTGIASASNGLQPSPTSTTFRSARLTFADGSGSFRIVCEVALAIELHSSIAKVERVLAGNVTEASMTNCSGGVLRVLSGSLPWHITFVSFEGTLPNITSVRLRINGYSYLQEAFFRTARCLYRANMEVTTVGNPVTELRSDGSRTIALFEEALSSISCPRTGRLEGTFAVAPTVRLTLV